MTTIIAGSRSATRTAVRQAMSECGWMPTSIISGGARGADAAGEEWAVAHNIPLIVIPAKWDFYGPTAGYRRNEVMAKRAEALVAVWDGESRGTAHMISLAEIHKLKVFVFKYKLTKRGM